MNHKTINDINEILEKKATKSELKSYVLRTHYEQVVTSLGTAIDTKSSEHDLNQIQSRVEVNVY